MRTILLTLALSLCLQAQVSIGSLISTPGSSINGDAGTYVFAPGINGAKCNDPGNGTGTDDTTAFNALLSTVNTAGGGRILIAAGCLIAGNVVFPNNGASVPQQSTIEIYGYGNTTNGVWGAIPAAAIPLAKSFLNLTNNATVAKLDTRGEGQLIIHDLNLIDSSTDCASFIQTTNTGLTIYDVTFSGTAISQAACNDALVFGGTTTGNNGTSTSSFQGYGTDIHNNYFDRMRRAGNFQVFANGVKFYDNTISASSGSNLTTAISACTNATPTVCTSTAHGLGTPVVNQTATSYPMTIVGATGNWTPLNGAQQATPIDANTFSIAVNSTGFGALTGSPAYYSGAVLDFNGNNGTSTIFGAEVTGNLVETKFYARFVNSTFGTRLNMKGNNLYDSALGVTSVYYWFGPSAIQNMVIPGHQDVSSSVPTVNISTAATVLDGSNSGYNVQGNAVFPQLNVVLGPLGTNAVNVSSPSTNSSGIQFKFTSNVGGTTKTGLFQMDNTGNLVFRASSNPIFLDYTTSLNMRAGAGGGGTQFALTSTGLTLSVPQSAIHYKGGPTAPTVAAGGAISTTPTITGTDFVGTVSVPSSAVTTGTLFTITFGVAYGSAPNCLVSQNGGLVSVGVGHNTPGTGTLVVTAAIANVSAAAYLFDYVCSGN